MFFIKVSFKVAFICFACSLLMGFLFSFIISYLLCKYSNFNNSNHKSSNKIESLEHINNSSVNTNYIITSENNYRISDNDSNGRLSVYQAEPDNSNNNNKISNDNDREEVSVDLCQPTYDKIDKYEHVLEHNYNNNNNREITDKTDITNPYELDENKQIIKNRKSIHIVTNNKLDLSNVNSKYLIMLNQKRNAALYKNYLHKSQKPFLGYAPKSNDSSRIAKPDKSRIKVKPLNS